MKVIIPIIRFRYKKRSIINYSSNGISIIIKDAESLPIDEKYIDNLNLKKNIKDYSTCRNWQFANYFKKYLENEVIKNG